jgi:hypothetical protein
MIPSNNQPDSLPQHQLRQLQLWARLREDQEFQELYQRGVLEGLAAEALGRLRTCPDADLPKVRAAWMLAEDTAKHIERNFRILDEQRLGLKNEDAKSE